MNSAVCVEVYGDPFSTIESAGDGDVYRIAEFCCRYICLDMGRVSKNIQAKQF